jgi:hypothetical protein
VFFLMSVMVVSMLLTRGKRVFGPIWWRYSALRRGPTKWHATRRFVSHIASLFAQTLHVTVRAEERPNKQLQAAALM